MSNSNDAFVLEARVPIERESPPPGRYDEHLQIWVNTQGTPVVTQFLDSTTSDLGETIMTKTHEGVDQVEGDSRPRVLPATQSDLGETQITETREGVDQSEGSIGRLWS